MSTHSKHLFKFYFKNKRHFAKILKKIATKNFLDFKSHINGKVSRLKNWICVQSQRSKTMKLSKRDKLEILMEGVQRETDYQDIRAFFLDEHEKV